MFLHYTLLFASVYAERENCNTPRSLWDTETCRIKEQAFKYQTKCIPERLYPSDMSSIKGIIMLYHGFTACPDSFAEISQVLRNQGYITLAPLLPGHGIKLGYGCEQIGKCVYNDTNPSFLPVNKKEYTAWVDWTLAMLREEILLINNEFRAVGFHAGLVGLSAGGPLALYAASKSKALITKFVLVNPWFSYTNRLTEFKIRFCDGVEDPESCVIESTQANISMIDSRKIIEEESLTQPIGSCGAILKAAKIVSSDIGFMLAKNTIGKILVFKYDYFLLSLLNFMTSVGENWINNIVNVKHAWETNCFDIDRGGLCAIRIRNIFALQALAEYSLSRIDLIQPGVRLDVIQSDSDGPIADSISHAVLAKLISQGIQSSKCKYLLKCSLDRMASVVTNECGAPHSIFSHAENLAVPPYEMYWESDLFENIINVFEDGISSVGTIGSTDPSVCASTNATMGYGPMFDNFGPKYLAKAKVRYSQ